MVILSTLFTCLVIAALICVFSTKLYKATAELQVGKEAANNLGLTTTGPQEPPEDSIDESITLQTQVMLLQSETLALKVINDLNLEKTEAFRPKFNPLGYVMGLFTPAGPSDPAHASLEDSPRRREHVLKVFSKNLKVKPVSGTRLIDISYLDPNPKLAAEVVNRLAYSLIDYNFQLRHDANAHTAQWLTGQMADLRKQSEDLQAKVANLQRQSGVFSLGETDASGREQIYSSVLDKLQQATTAYSQAQGSRIGKEAIYKVAQSGDPEAISQLSGSSIFASSSGIDSSLSLIQSMRMQAAVLRGQIGELASKFDSGYPKLQELRSHLDSLDESIKAEVARVAARARNDYLVAQQVENNAREVYLAQKRQADMVNNKTIEYMIAKKEAEESRNLYEGLFRELKQSGVLAGFRAENISLVDPARVPAKPSKPNILLFLAGAIAGGLFLGAGAALAKDTSDGRIRDVVALESELGQVPLGMLPFHQPGRVKIRTAPGLHLDAASGTSITGESTARSREQLKLLPAIYEPQSPYVEALRALRTSLILSKDGPAPKVILITSSMPGEGKSMLSANFAAVLAQQGKKVLLVDADLRHSNIDRILGISNETGLSSLLSADAPVSDSSWLALAKQVPGLPTLRVIPSGPVPGSPADLLSSDRLRLALNAWRQEFDFVIFDGAPVLPVTDSVVLSSSVDFTLLAARYKFIEQQMLRNAYRILQGQVGHQNLGIVLNAMQKDAGAYYAGYGYGNPKAARAIGGTQHENA